MSPLSSEATNGTGDTEPGGRLDIGGGRDEVTTGGDEDDVAVRERFTAAATAEEDAAVEEDEATDDSAAVEVRSAVERESAGFWTAMI